MIERIGRLFRGIAYSLNALFSDLELELKQAHTGKDAITYLSETIAYSILIFITVITLVYSVYYMDNKEDILTPIIISLISSLFMFYYRINLPKMIVRKRVENIEKNLAFGLQSLYIQIGSGVAVFDALESISRGKYGELSREIGFTANDIHSGKPYVDALEELAIRNPSPYFQRVIWQIVNTIKTGGNLKENLDYILKEISRDQINVIKSYGGKLSMLSMAYMMAAVIIPSLGITLLITISSLPSIGTRIDTGIFWLILVITLILQIQFAMVIQSSRPNLIG